MKFALSVKSQSLKYPVSFSKTWFNHKKIYFRYFESSSNVNEETMCQIQRKPNPVKDEVVATLNNGSELKFNVGTFAKFADGCATVTLNDTTVLATAVAKIKPTLGVGFLPLSVTYHQKAAALGRIPLNYLRREIGQTENEVLTSRVIDRSIRPLFSKKFNWETQIICSPLAIDGNTFPDVLSINAASAALAISNIPWNGPVSAVRVGLIKDKVVINPNKKELLQSSLDLIVVSKESKYIVMLEGSCKNVSLSNFLKAIEHGVNECSSIILAIQSLKVKCGKEKRNEPKNEVDLEFYNKIKSASVDLLKQVFFNVEHDKISRDVTVSNIYESVLKELDIDPKTTNVSDIFNSVWKEVFRDLIFEENVRCDGRSFNMLRNILCEVNLYKPLHGSAIFQRGQTQVLCTVALDSPNSAMKMDRISMLTSGLKEKNFFVHYEFPPFATKEVGRLGLIGRREIGHGQLAEKALKANIPDDFPFTIRLTSEVLESNGSSSMATVCGGTLALLDAGVPMLNPCAGVAMGVVTKWSEDNSEVTDFRILTDLLGIEDYMGDMDMKVAGTNKHITAIQMDVKVPGLPSQIVMDSIKIAKDAISTVLKELDPFFNQLRDVKKDNWPVMKKISLPVHQRSIFIGTGGINLKKLELETGVEITEENLGEFNIFATNNVAMEEALSKIDSIIESNKEPVLDFAGVYTATIVEIKENGCMVILYPNMRPVFIPNSQLDHRKISHASALNLQVGNKIIVKYFGRDPVTGSMRLSRKVLQSTASETTHDFFKSVEKIEKVAEKKE